MDATSFYYFGFGRGKKFGGVSRWFLQGVLRFWSVFVVVNRGEVVVIAWLIVVACEVFSAVEKPATFLYFFEIYLTAAAGVPEQGWSPVSAP